jgi:hypothetical protein
MLFHPRRGYRTLIRDVSFSDYLMASAVASAVVKQYDRYDLEGLSAYVCENFPTILIDARPYLVIGADTGTQYAAQIHFLAETPEALVEPDKQIVAAWARGSLSSWAIGLHRYDTFLQSDGRITSANDILLPSKLKAVPDSKSCT